MTAPAVELLAAARARRRVGAIRDALAVADDLLAQAFAERDWAALGHPDWPAYCAAELPELRHLKLRTPARRARVAALLAAGSPSVRDVAAVTGSSVGTAHADLAALQSPPRVGERAPVAGRRDDSVPPPPAPRTVRVLELLAAAGPAGLTVEQVRRRTRWHHGAASAALSRLHAAGRIGYRPPARRGLMGVYVADAAGRGPLDPTPAR